MNDVETQGTSGFDEGDVDALSVLQADAYDRAADSEATAKAFSAVVALSEVFARVCAGNVRIEHRDQLVEQVKRLAHIMEDHYAANPDA